MVLQVAGLLPGGFHEGGEDAPGLLASHRLASGHRRYDDSAPAVVRRIRALLDAGLPTRVIRDLPCRPAARPWRRRALHQIDQPDEAAPGGRGARMRRLRGSAC
ncbi:MerR family transcriptional regulator [Streptomyces sp. NPDC057302]|uniref:MerR family transcriptional regulator n=1 Tax=Streptomyces sp. NPDC057302 TaxID=3346094 RepID=UPI0036301912